MQVSLFHLFILFSQKLAQKLNKKKKFSEKENYFSKILKNKKNEEGG